MTSASRCNTRQTFPNLNPGGGSPNPGSSVYPSPVLHRRYAPMKDSLSRKAPQGETENRVKSMSDKILLLAGDGIGPEVMAEAERVLNWMATERGIRFETERGLVGGA